MAMHEYYTISRRSEAEPFRLNVLQLGSRVMTCIAPGLCKGITIERKDNQSKPYYNRDEQ